MIKVYQTRMKTDEQNGNCYAAVIASIMEKDSAEDVIQIQEHYDSAHWVTLLDTWLASKGWDLCTIPGHLYDGRYYFVSGGSPRRKDIRHIVIYQNGVMVHDPHPDGSGITEDAGSLDFSILERL